MGFSEKGQLLLQQSLIVAAQGTRSNHCSFFCTSASLATLYLNHLD